MQRIICILSLLLVPYYVVTGQTPSYRVNSGNLPAGYYNTAEGLNCSALKTALSGIISNSSNTFLYADVIVAHEKTDKKRNDNNTSDVVWDMYSDNPTGADPYTFTFISANRCGQYTKEGDCYNREHTFPQSWFNSELPMMSDLNHVFPTDGFVNALRANFPFGEVTTISKTSLNGSKLGNGNNFGYTGTVFEPINAYKGDIARAILYMIVRYESQLPQWKSNSNANDILDGNVYPGLDPWHLKLLYKWHVQDPVSEKERNRNDSVYVIMGNRNPFIDRPEWVFQIWSCTGLITNTSIENHDPIIVNKIQIYPNPTTSGTLQIQLKKSSPTPIEYELIDMQGRVMIKNKIPAGQNHPQLNMAGLKNGTYMIRFRSQDLWITEKIIVAKP
jgi:endonuclease I